MAHLIVQIPDQESRRVELEESVVVGRVAPADIVVPDAKVSRRHCKISKSRTGWTVTDLGSSNGTRVAGRVVKAHKLSSGDRVEVGLTVLVFQDDEKAERAAPVRASARERLSSRRRR